MKQDRAIDRLQEIASALRSDDLDSALPAVAALHSLADLLEARLVKHARADGWTWQAIADRLGITRQSVHGKHARTRPRTR